MKQTVQEHGPLRKKWEHWLQVNRLGLRSLRSVAEYIGQSHHTLTKAVNIGVGPDYIREALQSKGIPADLIPLPNCTKVLAGMYFEAQEKLGRCQKI